MQVEAAMSMWNRPMEPSQRVSYGISADIQRDQLGYGIRDSTWRGWCLPGKRHVTELRMAIADVRGNRAPKIAKMEVCLISDGTGMLMLNRPDRVRYELLNTGAGCC